RPRLADRHARRRKGARGPVRALSRRRTVHAGPRARIGVTDHRTAAHPYVVHPAAAAGETLLSSVPAAVSDRHRAVLVRGPPPHRQPEPLLREVDRAPWAGAASLLLPYADAVRVGPVRRLFRAGPHRPGAERRDAAGDGGAGPLGPRHRRPRGPLCRY